MAKNKQQIKFEADISGFKTNIKEAEKSITNLNNQLKLNQSQLNGNSNDSDLLSQRIETLKLKYEEQSKVVESTRKSYEKAVEIFGENSKEAENLKNKLIQSETAQQNIKNAIDKTNQQLNTQTDKLIFNSKKWQESGERLKDYGSKIENVGNKASILSGAIAGISILSLKASIDFESAFAGVTKTVDGTNEQLASLRQGILDMTTELPSSAIEISAVAESAGQLGIKTDNILDFTRVMIDLGNSTNVSADVASSALAKFANVTKMSEDDYQKLGSTIVALGNHYATTEADIINMGQNLASAGTQVGMSQSDIMALATALSSVGLEAQAGGTSFSKALVEMQLAVETNSKDLKNWASVAGMSTKNFAKLFKKDATSALQAFIKGLSECGGESESAIKILDDMGITETRMRDALLRSANASDTFSSAIELGSKSWIENTALTDEASKRYETTESQMQMLKNETVKLAIGFGDELAPSLRTLLDDAKPALKTITSAVKGFADLDDKTKKNIIRISALAVALGPAIKIGGNVIKTYGSVKTSIGTLTGAIGVLKNGTEGASKSSINLATSLKSVFSPTGIATMALLAGTAMIIKGISDSTEATRKLRVEAENNRDKILEESESLNRLRTTTDENVQTELNHIDRTKLLWEELKNVTDENGNVKEGYENRAKVITGELSNALDTEISMTGNVIDKYKDLESEIDNLILKKQGESILNGYKDKFDSAVNIKDQKVQELLDLDNEISETQSKLDESDKELTNVANVFKIGGSETTVAEHSELEKRLSALNTTRNETKKILDNSMKDIENYNYAYELSTQNTTESVQALVDSVGKTYTKNGETVETTYTKQMKAQQYYLDDAKIRNAKAVEDKNEAEKKKTQLTIDESNRRIKSLIQELASQTSLVGENSEDVINAWKALATDSYDTYIEEVSKLPLNTQIKIQEMTGVVVTETPSFASVLDSLAQSGVAVLDKNAEFREKAIQSLNGYLSGLTNEEQRAELKQAGIDNIDAVMQELKNGDLSEERGTEILKGIYNGLGIKSFQNDLYGRASAIAGTLSNLFSIKATVSSNGKVYTSNGTLSVMNKLPGHKDGLDFVPYDNYVARLHKGERVLTSEENKQYMSDNLGNKIENRNIIVQFFPQTMTENELQKAEKYISKKWGMAL